MNPWTVLLIGIVIGWLVEYAIDWFYWRRKPTDEQIIADLQQQLKASQQHSAELESQFATVGMGTAAGSPLTISDDVVESEENIPLEEPEDELYGGLTDETAVSKDAGFYDDDILDASSEQFADISELDVAEKGIVGQDLAEYDAGYEEIFDEPSDIDAIESDFDGQSHAPTAGSEESADESSAVIDEETLEASPELASEAEPVEEIDAYHGDFEPAGNEPGLEEISDITGDQVTRSSFEDYSSEPDADIPDVDAFGGAEGGQRS